MAASVTNQLIKLLSSLQGADLSEAKKTLKDYEILNDTEHRNKIAEYLAMVFNNRPDLKNSKYFESNYQKVDKFFENLIGNASQLEAQAEVRNNETNNPSTSPGKSKT